MLQQLHNLLVVVAQMGGLTILAVGCLIIAGAIFSGRPASFVKGFALILIGGWLAGFGAALH